VAGFEPQGLKNSPGANFDNGFAVGPEGVEGRKPGTILPPTPAIFKINQYINFAGLFIQL